MKHLREADVIVMNFNRLPWLIRCLESIEAHTKDVTYELTIVDAGSSDGSREFLLQHFPHHTLVFESRPYSYEQSNNRAMRFGRAPYVALMNNDCMALPGWLRNGIDALKADPLIGFAVHKVLRPDGKTIMCHGANVDENGNTVIPFLGADKDDPSVSRPMNMVYSGFGVYRRDVLEAAGFFQEIPVRIYWSDTDFGMKVYAMGLQVRYIPESAIIHAMVHAERGPEHGMSDIIGRRYFMDKWGDFLRAKRGFTPTLEPLRPEDRPWISGHRGKVFPFTFQPLGWAVGELGVGKMLDEEGR